MRASKPGTKGENDRYRKKHQFFVSIAAVLVFAAIVLAGGPSYIIENIPDNLRETICAYKSSSPTCFRSKYRTIDGSCNNNNNPLWGTPNSLFKRFLPAQYGDGISSFQNSVTGNELANPRKISKIIFGNLNAIDPKYTIGMMQFGQIIAHDMSYRLESSAPSCCSGNAGEFLLDIPTQCFVIPIPFDDPGYLSNITCMNFKRNVNTEDLGCPRPSPGEAVNQINIVTSFLDLSIIYGVTEKLSKSLRTLQGGKLITITRNGHEWPPQDPNAIVRCFQDAADKTCYLGGDERLNQSPHLTVIHILYIREHNRIADALVTINPQWDDEKLYQEARRINIAQYQYVSYYEWLTIFLGKQNMIDFELIYHFSGDEYVNDYDSITMPATYNEHAHAAFRFFHTQIEGHLNLVSEARETKSTIRISDHFDNPNITEDNFDDFARSLVYQNSQQIDSNFDTEIREFLFKHKDYFGQDLRAIDIQRGRDHGVARYNDFREFCGLPRATQWDDYTDLISTDNVDKLKSVYESFEDVELSVGAMLEMIIDQEALAGPTLLCIFNSQFLITRTSDRYWFESGDQEVAFSRPQLAEIRKSSFARLLCDNSNNVTTIQPQAFFLVDDAANKLVPCSDIPVVDLTKWKE